MSKNIYFLTSTLFTLIIIFNEINYISGKCGGCWPGQYCCGNTCCRSDHCCGKKTGAPECRPNNYHCCGENDSGSCPNGSKCASIGCLPNKLERLLHGGNITEYLNVTKGK
ncbi:hypothetical protein Mgra_00007613, partial [Meloidogyne graminicola]